MLFWYCFILVAGFLRSRRFQGLGLETFGGLLFLGSMVVFLDSDVGSENDTLPKNTLTWAMASPVFRFEVRLPPKQVPSIGRCVGTWIHPRWILSAAHCVPADLSEIYPLSAEPSTPSNPKPNSNQPDPGKPLQITQSLLHPVYDVALLHSETPYIGSALAPSSLAKTIPPDMKPSERFAPGAWIVPPIGPTFTPDSTSQEPDATTEHSRLTLHRSDAHTLRFHVLQGDLQRGDSGAPMFFEATQSLVGILIAGSPPSPSKAEDQLQGWQTAQRLDHPNIAAWLRQSISSPR